MCEYWLDISRGDEPTTMAIGFFKGKKYDRLPK